MEDDRKHSIAFLPLIGWEEEEEDPPPARLSQSLQCLFSFNGNHAFELLVPEDRALLLDDLFEADKCHFHSAFNLRLEAAEPEARRTQQLLEIAGQDLDSRELAEKLLETLGPEGLPAALRPAVWKRIIGNSLRINRRLFAALLAETGRGTGVQPAICRDIDRTLSHFRRILGFADLLREAELLLQMFCLFRPDVGYVQGMSYVMLALLLVFPPYPAFKAFCNLVLATRLLFRSYRFKGVGRLRRIVKELVARHSPSFHAWAMAARAEVWDTMWMEWLYALFLRSFDLRSALVLWDFFVLQPERLLFGLCATVFALLEEDFPALNKDCLGSDCRLFALRGHRRLLERLARRDSHDFHLLNCEEQYRR